MFGTKAKKINGSGLVHVTKVIMKLKTKHNANSPNAWTAPDSDLVHGHHLIKSTICINFKTVSVFPSSTLTQKSQSQGSSGWDPRKESTFNFFCLEIEVFEILDFDYKQKTCVSPKYVPDWFNF